MPGATLEELNFKLIIDDADFNAKVNDVLKTAQDLNANLSQILDIKQKISSVSSADVANQKNANKILADNAKTQEKIATDAERAAQARRKVAETTTSQITRENAVNREKEAREALKTAMAQERLNQLQERGRRTLMSTSRLWQQMAAAAATYFSVAGATRLISSLVQVSAEFEMQKVTLGAILQDVEKAGELFDQLKELAVKSPFQFKELASYAKQLSAFSVPVGELYDTTKMLADVSAGLGVGMDRLVLAYGQIRSASFLRGQEVRQLTEAGIPILEELRKQFVALGEEGITVGDVFDKISKRLVPFSMVEKVFKDMTSEGGKFYQMQEVQAETLKGKISNLTDAYQIMFSEIGEKHEGLLKGSVDALRGIAENYQKIGSAIVGLVGYYGAYRTALIAVRALEIARRAAMVTDLTVMKAFGAEMLRLTGITKAYHAVVKYLKNLNWAAVGIGAVTGLAMALANSAIQAGKLRKELKEITTQHADDADKLVKEFQELKDRLAGATQGSQAYRDAISDLNRKYGEYLPNLLTEKTTLADLEALEYGLTNAIYARARAYAEAEGQRKIEDRYGDRANRALENFYQRLDWAGITGDVATEFAIHFRDAIAKNPKQDAESAFEQAFKEYFGEPTPEALNVWDDLTIAADQYASSLKKVNNEMAKFGRVMDARFGAGATYGSLDERTLLFDIDKDYREKQDALYRRPLTEEARLKELTELEKEYLAKKKEIFEQDEKQKGKPGIWQKQIKDIDEALKKMSGAELSSFQKLVNPLITGEGVKDLLVQPGETQSEYFDKLRKDYKTVAQDYKDADAVLQKLLKDKEKGLKVDDEAIKKQREGVAALENRKKVIETIGDTLGISVDDKVTHPRGKRQTKSQEQIDLENQIDTLKDLYTWYKRFKDLGLSDEKTNGILAKFFPDQADIINGGQLERQLLADADAMEKYGAAGQKAASNIRDFLNVGGVKGEFESIKEQFQAFEKYRQKIQDWMDKDYNLAGTGLSAKISGILSNLATKNAQAATDANDLRKLFAEATKNEATVALIREKYGQEAWDKYLAKGESVIDELLKAETRANKEAAQERINALADEYVRRELFERNLNLSDWADKSLSQVLALRDGLRDMYEGPIDLGPEAQAEAQRLGVTLEELAKLVQMIIGRKMDESTIEAFKKIQSLTGTAVNSISNLGDIVSGLGDGIDDRDLRRFGQLLSTTGEILETITACDSVMAEITGTNAEIVEDADKIGNSADIWTMLIKLALVGLKSIANAFTENYQRQVAINEAAQAYRDTLHQIAIEDADTIFGTNTVQKAAEGFRNLRVQMEAFQAAQERNVMKNNYTNQFVRLFQDIATLRGLSVREWRTALDEWNGAMNSSYEDSRDYFEWLVSNQDVITKDMSKSQKAAFDDLINNIEDYKKAMNEMEDVMSGVFGNLGSDIADSLINAFIETGDAATGLADNMRDTFSELGLEIANSLISSFVISNILDKYRDTVESLFGYMSDASADPDVIAQKFGQLADNITQDADAAAQFTNALLTAMQNNGIDLSGEGGTKAMGNGIKSITEDTANLLASYINAIRADVSVTRTMVAAILGLLPAAPTLSEYLAQIQANTYNNAVATQAILERLDSSMAAFPNGGRAFNVNIS